MLQKKSHLFSENDIQILVKVTWTVFQSLISKNVSKLFYDCPCVLIMALNSPEVKLIGRTTTVTNGSLFSFTICMNAYLRLL